MIYDLTEVDVRNLKAVLHIAVLARGMDVAAEAVRLQQVLDNPKPSPAESPRNEVDKST